MTGVSLHKAINLVNDLSQAFDFNTLDGLRKNVVVFPDKKRAIVKGYDTIGLGGGSFFFDSTDSTSVDNDGTIVVDANGGRWIREAFARVDASWFGIKTTLANNAVATNVALSLGLPLDFGPGTYLFEATIELNRGNILSGNGVFDTINHSTTLKLADGANVTLINTPLARGEGSTHYIGLEKLVIDGNKANQTVEVNLVDYRGLFVGSYINLVFIRDALGRAIVFGQGTDIKIDHWWVSGTETSTEAVLFGLGNSGADREGLITGSFWFIENTSRNNLTVPRDNEDNRSTALRIHNVTSLEVDHIHFEAASRGLVFTDCDNIDIGGITGFAMGRAAVTDTGYVVQEGSAGNICLNVGMLRDGGGQSVSNLHWVHSEDSFNELPTLLVSQSPSNTLNGINCNARGSISGPMGRRSFTNEISVVKVGSFSSPGYTIFDGDTELSTTRRFGMRLSGGELTVFTSPPGSNVVEDFVTYRNTGNPGSSANFSVPIRPGARSTLNNMSAGVLFEYDNAAGVGPAWITQVNEAVRLVGVLQGVVAPTASATYIGQMFLDTAARKSYQSFSIGNGAGDWELLN